MTYLLFLWLVLAVDSNIPSLFSLSSSLSSFCFYPVATAFEITRIQTHHHRHQHHPTRALQPRKIWFHGSRNIDSSQASFSSWRLWNSRQLSSRASIQSLLFLSQNGNEDSLILDGGGEGGGINVKVNQEPASPGTVWTEFARLSQEFDVSANLGQGYPDWSPPQFVLESLWEASQIVQNHQYTRTAGHPSLVQLLAQRYSTHLNRTIEPMTQVAITVGASQALYLSLQTLIQPGDEVLVFQPFFDLYIQQIKLAGGIPFICPLTFVPYQDDDDDDVSSTTATSTTPLSGSIKGGEWVLDPELLRSKLSRNRTKAIILNSPHNPTGKVFTPMEMKAIAEALESCARDDCVVLSDEVYKYIVHAPPPTETSNDSYYSSPLCEGHIHFASLPRMWNRTITISSAGKTFSATGWQVGWCIGPSHCISRIHQLLPNVQFCASTLLQDALARSLPKADLPYEGYSTYYEYLKATYTRKRDLLRDALVQAGFGIPNFDRTAGGGFFLLARIGPGMKRNFEDWKKQQQIKQVNHLHTLTPNNNNPDTVPYDWAFCQWLIQEKGIVCIPASPFFLESIPNVSEDGFIRVAFCKTDETIQAAATALGMVQGDANNIPQTTQQQQRNDPTLEITSKWNLE